MNKIRNKLNYFLIQKYIKSRHKTLNNKIDKIINKLDYYILNEIKYILKNTELTTLICIEINSDKKRLNIDFFNNLEGTISKINRTMITKNFNLSEIYHEFLKKFEDYITNFCKIYNFELDVHIISNSIIYEIKLKEE